MTRRFDSMLKNDVDIERWSTYIGQGAVRFYLPMLVQLPNNSFAQAVVLTKNLAARERVHDYGVGLEGR